MRNTGILISNLVLVLSACSGNSGEPTSGSGGAVGNGTVGNGGAVSNGGTVGNGGAVSNGGTVGNGGAVSNGGSGGSPPANGGSTSGTPTNAGGATSKGGSSTVGGAATGGAATGGATTSGGVTGSCFGNCTTAAAGACTAPQVRITPVNLGAALSFGAGETDVLPLAIAAMPGGGSRIAWMTGYGSNVSSTTGQLHLAQLDCDDKMVGTSVTFAAHDFQDIAEDGNGGVIVLTRDAQGGGTLNCGDPANLCGTPPSPPIACYDMYMVRHDCAGQEQWATKLTTSSATTVPYAAAGSNYNYMVWWYQHQGRIAYDGTNYAAYFCDGIVVQNGPCVDIHQGDRMQVVGPSGSLLTGHNSFALGCSHSGFTRIVWDQAAGKFGSSAKCGVSIHGNRASQ